MLKKAIISISVFVFAILLSGCNKKTDAGISGEPQMGGEQVQEQENAPSVGGEGVRRGRGGEGPKDGTGRRMNFAEAQEACADKTEGEDCQFTITNEGQEDREVTGTCKKPMQMEQEEEGLSCRPDKQDMLRNGVPMGADTEK